MKKVLIIIGIVVIGFIIGFTSYNFFTENNIDKLIYKQFYEGYGDGSGNYSITIWDSGRVDVYSSSNKKTYYVDKEKIKELQIIINENFDKVECVPDKKFDAPSTEITIYKDDKEILLDSSWNKTCNENFDKINAKIIEIQKLQN